jgi:hypothetical protein
MAILGVEQIGTFSSLVYPYQNKSVLVSSGAKPSTVGWLPASISA